MANATTTRPYGAPVPERTVEVERGPTREQSGAEIRLAWATIPLRLMLGFGFLYHGIPKVFSAEAHQAFVAMLASLSLPAPAAFAWGVGLLEVIGGACLVLGLLTRLASLLLIVEMVVAVITVGLPQGFNFVHITGSTPSGPTFGLPGYEVNLLYIAGLLALLIAGAGDIAADRIWLSRRRG